MRCCCCFDWQATVAVQAYVLNDVQRKLSQARSHLEDARGLVDDVMGAGGGALVDSFKIEYSDLAFGDTLGEGTFGTVYKAQFHGQTVAVKVSVIVIVVVVCGVDSTFVCLFVCCEIVVSCGQTLRSTKVTRAAMQAFRAEVEIM